jgi:hypothetical protein
LAIKGHTSKSLADGARLPVYRYFHPVRFPGETFFIEAARPISSITWQFPDKKLKKYGEGGIPATPCVAYIPA